MSGGCPIPLTDHDDVLLAHGGGGRLMHRLIERIIAPTLDDPELECRHDSAVLGSRAGRLAFTTDSHVVSPLFFPGGDIGTLAVHGTVNDLAMCGARPVALSCALILEEGLPLSTLERVLVSMREAARAAGVHIVTGDTKVVDRGKGDGIYINTAGLGWVEHDLRIGPGEVRAGDRILLSGDLGRHGMAILSQREGLGFESAIESDCAPVAAPVLDLLAQGVEVHCLRDLTRGGLAAAVTEIARGESLAIRLDETEIPVREDVRNACEIYGLDPMLVANEGRFLAVVPVRDAARALAILRRHPVSTGAVLAGEVTGPRRPGLVGIRTASGPERILDLPSGEQLPRIC